MKLHASIGALAVALAGCMNLAASAAPPPASDSIYAQLSSSVSQIPTSGKPLVVSMESNDGLSGIDHNAKDKPGDIKVKTAGAYFVMAAVQAGKESGNANEYVDLWLKQNGKDVANSGCRQAIILPRYTGVLVSQAILECKEGDVVNVAISASSGGKGVGIQAVKPKGEPAVPSIIFSMYKIR